MTPFQLCISRPLVEVRFLSVQNQTQRWFPIGHQVFPLVLIQFQFLDQLSIALLSCQIPQFMVRLFLQVVPVLQPTVLLYPVQHPVLQQSVLPYLLCQEIDHHVHHGSVIL